MVEASGESAAATELASEGGFSLDGDTAGWVFDIGDPRQIGEGVSAYIAYMLNSKNETSNANFSVARRYSDFVWVRDQLMRVYPGCIVPALPPKTIKYTTNILEDDFVKMRAKGLRMFLTGVARHTELRSAQ
jgi:sorting nexin-4